MNIFTEIYIRICIFYKDICVRNKLNSKGIVLFNIAFTISLTIVFGFISYMVLQLIIGIDSDFRTSNLKPVLIYCGVIFTMIHSYYSIILGKNKIILPKIYLDIYLIGVVIKDKRLFIKLLLKLIMLFITTFLVISKLFSLVFVQYKIDENVFLLITMLSFIIDLSLIYNTSKKNFEAELSKFIIHLFMVILLLTAIILEYNVAVSSSTQLSIHTAIYAIISTTQIFQILPNQAKRVYNSFSTDYYESITEIDQQFTEVAGVNVYFDPIIDRVNEMDRLHLIGQIS